MTRRAPDAEVLEPLRDEEQELDTMLERAREDTARGMRAAEARVQGLRDAARRDLDEELAGLALARASRLNELRQARRGEVGTRLAALVEAARVHHDEALRLVLERVTRGDP